MSTLKIAAALYMGFGSRGPCPSWIFIRGTDKVEGGLMVLLFVLVFSISPPLPEIFLLTPLALYVYL